MTESAATPSEASEPRRLAAVELRMATASDAPRLKTVLAEAFCEDPIFGWLMPDDASRLERLQRFFAIELRQVALPRGRVLSTDGLTGAALSMPPGRWRVPPRASLYMGATFGMHLPRAARLLGAMEWRHPREPHYYFANIGVAPELQGRGIGSALMRPTLERCDAGGLAAYLEASSERNAALYERLGFRLIRELRVAGGPPLRLMSRPPRLSEVTS
jgi:ribosomal protein S18 acetylase RimI-like enzyme